MYGVPSTLRINLAYVLHKYLSDRFLRPVQANHHRYTLARAKRTSVVEESNFLFKFPVVGLGS